MEISQKQANLVDLPPKTEKVKILHDNYSWQTIHNSLVLEQDKGNQSNPRTRLFQKQNKLKRLSDWIVSDNEKKLNLFWRIRSSGFFSPSMCIYCSES